MLNQYSARKFILLLGIFISFTAFAAKPTWSIEVKGTVTEKGQPLQGAVISLFSDSVLLQQVT